MKEEIYNIINIIIKLVLTFIVVIFAIYIVYQIWKIDIIELFIASLTPLILIVTAYIAYQQHRTNRYRLRLDLYEKRFKIFRTITELIASIVRNPGADHKTSEFLYKTSEADFLFDKEIPEYINDLYDKAILLESLEIITKQGSNNEDERQNAIKKSRELTKWFSRQFSVTRKLFSKYLSFRNI